QCFHWFTARVVDYEFRGNSGENLSVRSGLIRE
ncbi:unnamed protein product, partial [marine sediment metagenome]